MLLNNKHPVVSLLFFRTVLSTAYTVSQHETASYPITMKKLLLLSGLVITILAQACANDHAAQTPVMIAGDGYAIKGYDPVAYFVSGQSMKGSENYSAKHKEATWLFSSEANRDMFSANPEKYAPQYGGWCAFGMAEGYAAETDPVNAWAIHEGKLYLNWDESVAKDWKADQDALMQLSEKNWPDVRTQLDTNKATVYWHD